MEVRGGEVQRPPAGQAPGLVQHVGAVARAQAGIDDQRGTVADDEADVRHERHAVVRDHEDPVEDLDGVAPHDRRRSVPLIWKGGRRGRRRARVRGTRRGLCSTHDLTPI